MNRAPSPADALPGLLPHQQRHLHRHQRPGRPGAGAERMDGDAAGHRLRRRRRDVRRPGRPPSARLGTAARLPARPARRDRARRRCARGRRCIDQFWLLVAGATLAGYYNANAGLYRFAATEIVAPEFKERAISWVLAGGIIGAVAGPNLARVARNWLAGRVRRRLRRARRHRAAVAGDDLVDPLPAAGRAERRRAGPAAARDRHAAGLPRRRLRLRVRLRRDEPAHGGDADRDGDVLASVRQHRARPRVARARHVRAELFHRQPDPPLRRRAASWPRASSSTASASRSRSRASSSSASWSPCSPSASAGTSSSSAARRWSTTRLPAGREDARPGGDGHDDLHDHDDHLVQLRRAGRRRRAGRWLNLGSIVPVLLTGARAGVVRGAAPRRRCGRAPA